MSYEAERELQAVGMDWCPVCLYVTCRCEELEERPLDPEEVREEEV